MRKQLMTEQFSCDTYEQMLEMMNEAYTATDAELVAADWKLKPIKDQVTRQVVGYEYVLRLTKQYSE